MTTQDFSAWIGRQETIEDNIDIGHVQKIALSVGARAPSVGDPLPALWQWGLFISGLPYEELGEDGHPRRGGFLPPAGDNRNRMWAGGRVTFSQPLRVGTPGRKVSTILDVKEKEGRTGKLMFVTVRHDYFQNDQLCISEEQDIVYREPSPPKLQGSTPAPQAQWSETVQPSTTMLFRYSAVTFNGHRIHYDFPYVTEKEGYPGLVVHGPLIATLMCTAFVNANPDKQLATFAYRGLRPLIAPAPFQVAGTLTGEGTASAWAEQDGTLAHQAEVTFR
ncbi:MAG: itaconyl-CoA hydratase [Alcaligenaceae bacterium]|nr:itaconyl-CoA hydratase [Alcaligenaceae bacterium]